MHLLEHLVAKLIRGLVFFFFLNIVILLMHKIRKAPEKALTHRYQEYKVHVPHSANKIQMLVFNSGSLAEMHLFFIMGSRKY